jgi:hypothetical protein
MEALGLVFGEIRDLFERMQMGVGDAFGRGIAVEQVQ